MGGTLVDFPDIFEIITMRLVGRWPDKQTYDLAFEIYHGMVNAIDHFELSNHRGTVHKDRFCTRYF